MIEAWTDGSFSHDHHMGAGVVINIDGEVVVEVSAYYGKNGGKASGNYAEYAAVWELLEELKLLPEGPVTVYCDSMLVVRQLRGIWDIGNGAYAEMAHRVHDAIKQQERKMTFTWIPRKENLRADTLSKEAHIHKTRVCVRQEESEESS